LVCAAHASPPKPDLTEDPKHPSDPKPTKKLTPLEVKGPWYTGPYAKNRLENLAFTGVLGGYLLAASAFNFTPVPTSCRWCSVPGFDAGARHQLRWTNQSLADTLSSYDAYVFAPIVGLSLLIASDSDASPTRLIDDVLPVVETVAVVQVVTQFGKYAFARERPYAHYGGALTPGADTYSSFWSGHSVFGFAITSAAGTVAHFRHYWTEPYVWAAGITISLSTEYLRIAADKHYLSDVVVGGLVGLGTGLLIPRLMQRAVKIVPVTNGLAVAGSF
ncbi:MAG TPA: phosphatase PAP2 family protein, partial [Kofleriaceae bacterium]